MTTSWFPTPTTAGKATLDGQLVGLSLLPGLVHGKRVLDVGCAEGHIAAKCAEWGASAVYGVDNRPIAVAHAIKAFDIVAVQADVATYAPVLTFDVVLMLGILNKLREPDVVLERMLLACKETAVVRVSGGQWPMLFNRRLDRVAERCGFELVAIEDGPVDRNRGPQFVGYLTRG